MVGSSLQGNNTAHAIVKPPRAACTSPASQPLPSKGNPRTLMENATSSPESRKSTPIVPTTPRMMAESLRENPTEAKMAAELRWNMPTPSPTPRISAKATVPLRTSTISPTGGRRCAAWDYRPPLLSRMLSLMVNYRSLYKPSNVAGYPSLTGKLPSGFRCPCFPSRVPAPVLPHARRWPRATLDRARLLPSPDRLRRPQPRD